MVMVVAMVMVMIVHKVARSIVESRMVIYLVELYILYVYDVYGFCDDDGHDERAYPLLVSPAFLYPNDSAST